MKRSLKILHLAMDEKFIDQGFRAFEEAAPGSNEIYIYALGKIKYTKTNAHRTYSRLVEFLGVPTAVLSQYDLVVAHSLHPAWWKTIIKIPKSVPVLWIGWGYDYYDLVDGGGDRLLLPQTKMMSASNSRGNKGVLRSFIRFVKRKIFTLSKEVVLNRVDYFAPVLPEEYDLVRKVNNVGCFPAFIRWNYGNLEDDLVKGFENAVTSGVNILVGNSASSTNNHLEAFELLAKSTLSQERKIIAPLSYGVPEYKDAVIEAGRKYFMQQFQPLTEFMPIKDYVGIISSCSHVIMNQVRQQALGNIIIMLYLGAKVFVREESPVYSFFKSKGVHIYSIQELEKNGSLLSRGLLPVEIEKNRAAVIEEWSRKASQDRTRMLLQHIFTKNADVGIL